MSEYLSNAAWRFLIFEKLSQMLFIFSHFQNLHLKKLPNLTGKKVIYFYLEY